MSSVLLVGPTSHLALTLLPALLACPYLDRVLVLSRKPVPPSSAIFPLLASPKVIRLTHDTTADDDGDRQAFFPAGLFESTLRKHRVKAVLWLVGGPVSRFPSFDEAQRANVSLPLGFLEACLEHGVADPAVARSDDEDEEGGGDDDDAARSGKEKEKDKGKGNKAARYAPPDIGKLPLRFLYLSTYDAVQDSFAGLWRDGKFRKLKGAAEKALLGLAEEKGKGKCEVYCLRLGRVLDGGQTLGNIVKMGVGGYVTDELMVAKVVGLIVSGRPEGGGVVELTEILGDHWAEGNSVTVGYS